MTIIVPSISLLDSAALYNSMIADIYSLTKRSDRVAETALALRKATMKFHQADLWKNDLRSASVDLPVLAVTDDYRYTFDFSDPATYPLWRRTAMIKELNNPLSGVETNYKELDADRLLDSYRVEDIDYWYQAGQQGSLRSSKVLSAVEVTYYKYPNVTAAGYDSWIAQQFPDAIIEEAVSNVFRVIGKDAEARMLASNFADNLHFLTISQV